MVVTLTGANRYVMQHEQAKLVDAFISEFGDMALERLNGDEVPIERLGEALTSLPFLSSKKMVLIKQGSANKQFIERAAELLDNIPETTDVVLIEPKLDKRSSYYKYLKKQTDFRECNELDQAGLARWTAQLVKEAGGSISQADASYLVARIGQNQQLLAGEIDKLLLFSSKIDRDSIVALTEAAPQSTVFELLESAFNGNIQHSLQLYAEQRALKVEPQQIIAMLSWQLHILALIKVAGERSPDTIASEAKVSPYVVKKSTTIARKLSLAEIKRLVTDLAEIDGRSKRETFNIDDALQYYLLTLAT